MGVDESLRVGAPGIQPSLRWRDGDQEKELPAWTTWLVQAGSWFSAREPTLLRPVLAISVPIRDFASVLLTLGIHCSVYSRETPTNSSARFEWLSTMPHGTVMRWRSRGLLRTGDFVGVEAREQASYLKLRAGSSTWYVPRSSSLDVELLPDGVKRAPRPRKIQSSPFVIAALGIEGLGQHSSRNALDCLVVGPKEQLTDELEAELFLAGPLRLTGSLQELIRCRALMPNERDPFRTDLVTGYASDPPDSVLAYRPSCLVIEGSAGFLNWRDQLGRTPRCIVLDRSSPASESAALELTNARAMSAELLDLSPIEPLPAGIEAIGYSEAV